MVNKRNTIQRQLILNALKELNTHASAEQVYEYVIKKHPSISKATVYRNLNQMAESGEIINIGDFSGSAHYDHQCRNHYHFMCDNCESIFDIHDYFPDLPSQLKNAGEFEINRHNLNFYGLCQECKTKTTPTQSR